MKIQKKNKKLVIVFTVLAILMLAWGATTWVIGNSAKNRINDYVGEINKKIQADDRFFIKPRFVLKNFKHSFFSADFILSVEIENISKLRELHDISSFKSSGTSYMSKEELDDYEKQVNEQADFIHLIDINNTVKFGPFPKIGQGNLLPGLMDIKSVSTLNNLNPEVKKFLSLIGIEEIKQDLFSHPLLLAQTTLFFDSSIDTHMQSAPFDLNAKTFAVRFDGLELTFNNSSDHKLETHIGSFTVYTPFVVNDDINQEMASKFNTYAKDLSPMFSIGKIDLENNYENKAGEQFSGQTKLSVGPIAILDPYYSIPSFFENIKVIRFKIDGFELVYDRQIANDQIYNEQYHITFRPINALYLMFFDEIKYGKLNITPIKINGETHNTSMDLLLKQSEITSNRFKNIRQSIITGDFDHLLNRQAYLQQEFSQFLSLLTKFSGISNYVINPVELNLFFENKSANVNIKSGEFSSKWEKKGTDLNSPLLINSKLTSFDFNQPHANKHFSLKEYESSSAFSLDSFFPLTLDYSVGEINLANQDDVSYAGKKFNIAFDINNKAESLELKQTLKGEDITVNQVDLGSFNIEHDAQNLDKSAFTALIKMFVESQFNNIDEEHSYFVDEDTLEDETEDKLMSLYTDVLANGPTISANYTLSDNKRLEANSTVSLNVDLKPAANNSRNNHTGYLAKNLELIDKLTLNFDANINSFADFYAKTKALSTMNWAGTPSAENIQTNLDYFDRILLKPSSQSALSQLISINNETISSRIKIDREKVTINGQSRTLEDILTLWSSQ
ncbi:DUF945 family protein [Thorsellia kenyensis]|uniref:DUF945 family protein n=1 Tax=Thorsellia kenyensis TaxID=1549888 RepID=A0ABV6CBD5_9GAMM